jgi:hypothetical protein
MQTSGSVLAYPARVSFVPAQLEWFDKGGFAIPMFARYLDYIDRLLIALVAAGGVTTPQRVVAVPSQIPLIDPTKLATQPFARWISYLDAILTILTVKAISLGFVVPIGGNIVPPNVEIADDSGKPNTNFALYFLYVDQALQALVAAGV